MRGILAGTGSVITFSGDGTTMATVLYVDDEDAIRRVVATWLTRRGHVVHGAATLADAREVLETVPIDGAFIDLWLANESGLELQKWIDANRPGLSPHVVFVTGDVGSDQATSAALRALGKPVLAKPFELDELNAFVARWAENSDAGDS
jgi:DNA-binding NtrC family response regulator